MLLDILKLLNFLIAFKDKCRKFYEYHGCLLFLYGKVLGIYRSHGVDVTREEVQRIFDAADKDGTGLLTEQEFVNSSKPGEVAAVRQ